MGNRRAINCITLRIEPNFIFFYSATVCLVEATCSAMHDRLRHYSECTAILCYACASGAVQCADLDLVTSGDVWWPHNRPPPEILWGCGLVAAFHRCSTTAIAIHKNKERPCGCCATAVSISLTVDFLPLCRPFVTLLVRSHQYRFSFRRRLPSFLFFFPSVPKCALFILYQRRRKIRHQR